MFRPIGRTNCFLQSVNREVFSLTWVESTVYATGASGIRGMKRLSYSNWKVGSMDLVMFVIFDFIVCDLPVNCNWEILYGKLLAFSNL